MSVENYLPGDLCSGLIICWRKSSGEMSPGEKFLGERCEEFLSCTHKYQHLPLTLKKRNVEVIILFLSFSNSFLTLVFS